MPSNPFAAIVNRARVAWDKATKGLPRAPFVVYTPKPGVFCAFEIPEEVRDIIIDNTIARRENRGQSVRHYTGEVQPGSFNWIKVEAATDQDDAIAQAKTAGLAHEPIKTVLARSINEQKEKSQTAPSGTARDKDDPWDSVLKSLQELKEMEKGDPRLDPRKFVQQEAARGRKPVP